MPVNYLGLFLLTLFGLALLAYWRGFGGNGPRLAALAAILLLPVNALAATSGSAPLFQGAALTALQGLILTSSAAIGALLTKAFWHGVAWIQARSVIAGHAKVTAAIQRAEGIIATQVFAVGQTIVSTAKADLAAGKIDKPTYDKILSDAKTQAVTAAHADIAPTKLASDLRGALGLAPDASLLPAIETMVEAAVAKSKTRNATATLITNVTAPSPAAS